MNILTRRLRLVNTDPQRRCYNGCYASSELVWSEWRVLELSIPEEKVDRRIKFWKELNDYAVSERGEAGTKREFKVEPTVEVTQ